MGSISNHKKVKWHAYCVRVRDFIHSHYNILFKFFFMKKQFIAITFIAVTFFSAGIFSLTPAHAQDAKVTYVYKQITAIESVVPGGLGRSRILTTDDNGQMMEKDLKNF